MQQLKWACIGCGHIANEMAQAMAACGRQFCGVYSRTKENAAAFAARYGIPTVYDSAEALFADDIDIVYSATPHNRHIGYILQAAASGKHILCEKAITLNAAELAQATAACDKNGVVLAEAMTIFHLPVYKEINAYLQNGRLGRLKLLEVNLGSDKDYDMTNRFFNPDLAGGAMLDIGVYALSFVRWFMTETPKEIQSTVKLAPSGVDEQAIMLLQNSAGEMASVTLSLTAKLPRSAVASFENGYITLDNYNRSTHAEIIFNDGSAPVIFTSDSAVSPLVYEIEDMESAVGGDNQMALHLTADVMQIMTETRYGWGVKYPEENEIC